MAINETERPMSQTRAAEIVRNGCDGYRFDNATPTYAELMTEGERDAIWCYWEAHATGWQGINKATRPESKPSFQTVTSIAHALGLKVKFVPQNAAA